MGNSDSKVSFRRAVEQLTIKNATIQADDEEFWSKFWCDSSTSLQDVYALVTAAEIRYLRKENPTNLSTFCYKAVERLAKAVDNSVRSLAEQNSVMNCVRILIRILPYIFEDDEWINFFWTTLPSAGNKGGTTCLAQTLLNTLCDMLFCPDFTVVGSRRVGPDKAEELANIDSCEHIWEAGVGFAYSPQKNGNMEQRRTELLKLLLTCFSESMYRTSITPKKSNQWIAHFTSADNRHALPLFTSFLNTVCAYDPVGLGVPYNHLLFTDNTEPLVEACLQILIVTLDHDNTAQTDSTVENIEGNYNENLFINYLSRIHRDEDFQFILGGITRLLNNPLAQNYLPNSTKKVHCHQELLVFFWKICDYNKKFLYYTLKSSDVLEVLIPILYHLNYSRADQSRVGLMHIGVFILLLLSGERNFGVRLNKPYVAAVPMDIPVFTGTHADLLITVFHKIIATGHQRLQPLFDCLLTILVNVSPYLKTLSMVASVKLLHLLEAFSTPWFLLSTPNNHHLVFFILEMFNNIIQYQFDGNSNLVYTIIRKRHVFHSMANLPSDMFGIAKCLNARKHDKFKLPLSDKVAIDANTDVDEYESDEEKEEIMENAIAADVAESQLGTIKVTLLETPKINKMTEKESTYPTACNIDEEDVSSTNVENNISKDEVVDKTKASSNAIVIKDSIIQPMKSIRMSPSLKQNLSTWSPSAEWVASWRSKLPLQTIMRLLQVLVPQVEKICIDKGLTDETEILKFLQHGTLVGLLPVPHPILIRKYQANNETTDWFRTYMWGVIYLRNVEPAIWYDTGVKLFEIQKV